MKRVLSLKIVAQKTKHSMSTSLYYEKDKAPWDYPEEALQCLCENCHKEAKELQALLKEQIKQLAIIGGSAIEELIGYALGIQASETSEVIEITSYEMAMGVSDRFGLTAEQVIDALREKY